MVAKQIPNVVKLESMAYKNPNDPRLKEARLRWYYKNKEKQIARQLQRRKELLAWVRSLKVNCSKCNFNNPLALVFHHRNPEAKTLSIAQGITNGWNKKRLQEEIDKCDILCANCHSILHYTRGIA